MSLTMFERALNIGCQILDTSRKDSSSPLPLYDRKRTDEPFRPEFEPPSNPAES